MATTVGSLSVDLDLNSAAFINNMKRATESVVTSSKGIEAALNIGKFALSGYVAQFAGAKLGDAIKSGLDYASALGETAQQLGINTRELQVYRFAASQAGISQEEIDKGLARLTLTIGKAIDGNVKLSNVFSTLGVSVVDSSGNARSAGDVFEDLSRKLSNISDPAKRAAIEVALFGKTGQQLDTLLGGGADQIDNLRTAAERLGLVLDDKTIQQADDAADKLDALQQVLSTKIAAVVAENAGSIIKIADAILAAASATGQFFEKFDRISQRNNWNVRAQASLRERKDLPLNVRTMAQEMVEGMADRKFGVVTGKGVFSGFTQTLDPKWKPPAGKTEDGKNPPPAGNGEVLTPPRAGGGGRSQRAPRAMSAGREQVDEFRELEARLNPLVGATRDWSKALAIIDAEQRKVHNSALDEYFDRMRNSAYKEWQGRLGDQGVPGFLANVSDEIDIVRPKLSQITIDLLQMPNALDEAFSEARLAGVEGLIGGLENLRHGFGSLEDVALNVIDAIEGAFLDKLVYGPIRDWVANIGTPGGGGGGGLGSLFGSLFGGGRAVGGPVDGSKFYMVGERGPELFAPGGQGGTIIPNDALRGGGSGASIVINAPGATAETVAMIRREIQAAAPQIVAASRDVTLKSANRRRLG